MARNGLSPSTKRKAKAYGPPTRALLRLAAQISHLAANLHTETPVTPAVPVPSTARQTAWISVKSYSIKLVERDDPSNTVRTPMFPHKKHPIQKAAGGGTSKAAT
ncbi:hypothetical protein PIB30_060656 [Stylosanthes scabra]|uniref:Uncharacterized protein n=1 Tax=Stylosanthes scabra TaxID=79078 RepID=A0ABU6UJE7_9FABA|nr:hypothetical protein [Stylosanthes scabra]